MDELNFYIFIIQLCLFMYYFICSILSFYFENSQFIFHLQTSVTTFKLAIISKNPQQILQTYYTAKYLNFFMKPSAAFQVPKYESIQNKALKSLLKNSEQSLQKTERMEQRHKLKSEEQYRIKKRDSQNGIQFPHQHEQGEGNKKFSNSQNKTRKNSQKIIQQNYEKEKHFQNAEHSTVICFQTLKQTSYQPTLEQFNFNKLLPSFMNYHLPPDFILIIKFCEFLDEFLSNLSSEKKMQNFNYLKKVAAAQGIEGITIDHLQVINSLNIQLYTFFEDPLKNLVICLPCSGLRHSIRKQNIVKCVTNLSKKFQNFHDLFESKKYTILEEDEQAQKNSVKNFKLKKIEPRKINIFFLQKEPFNSLHSVPMTKKKVTFPEQKFLEQVEAFIEIKNQRYQTLLAQLNYKEEVTQNLKKILQIIKNSFTKKNLTNLFKATVITILVKDYFIEEKQAICSVESLINLKNSCLIAKYQHKSGQIIKYNQFLYQKTLKEIQKTLRKQ